MFLRATAKHPDEFQLTTFLNTFKDHLDYYRQNTQAAKQLINASDAESVEPSLAAELAAWTMIANLILNLDEVVVKG